MDRRGGKGAWIAEEPCARARMRERASTLAHFAAAEGVARPSDPQPKRRWAPCRALSPPNEFFELFAKAALTGLETIAYKPVIEHGGGAGPLQTERTASGPGMKIPAGWFWRLHR